MGVVRTPARAIFKNNLNMLFLNINRAIDTTCIHIDTKCNSNRHNILRNHEIGNDSRIIFKTQICMVPWNSKMQKLKIFVACGAIFYVFNDHGSLKPFCCQQAQGFCAVMNSAHEARVFVEDRKCFQSFIILSD